MPGLPLKIPPSAGVLDEQAVGMDEEVPREKEAEDLNLDGRQSIQDDPEGEPGSSTTGASFSSEASSSDKPLTPRQIFQDSSNVQARKPKATATISSGQELTAERLNLMKNITHSLQQHYPFS